MEINEDETDPFETAFLSCLLLFFSSCAWLIPFVAINEEGTFALLSLNGDTWFIGIGLILWFGLGSYLLTKAEAKSDDSQITNKMYFKKLLMVPFAPILSIQFNK